ncbi:MAG: ATP-grasp domain-containing protein [Firmicutes bacterium]|nr:ATP-grasp domain-containing protein [Bacillota bacterium]
MMILGASKAQVNAIKRMKEMGYQVIASDYYEDSIGKKIADHSILASTFSYEETYEKSREFHIDGVMTTGTDQPVLVVSKLAEKMGLPCMISSETALNVTNKKYMKKLLDDNNIPLTDYRLIREDFSDDELEGLKFPLVVKPVDSQGQRGIFLLDSLEDIRKNFKDVIVHSREKEILVEEYYKNDEITVSGWVRDGQVNVLTITDRVIFDDRSKLGVCISHEFPSVHFNEYGEEIIDVTKRICDIFKIDNGPIYFQMFIGSEGLKVNELACRIGGAYEDEVIPYLTGVDILKMLIDYSLGNDIDYSSLESYDIFNNSKCSSTQLFFAVEGKIEEIVDEDIIRNMDYVLNLGFNFSEGFTIPKIVNATQRAGYVIITAESEEKLIENIDLVFDDLYMKNDKNENMIIRGKRGNRN